MLGSATRERDEFSAALCRGLIEAAGILDLHPVARGSFPRLYAAASLKHRIAVDDDLDDLMFSAALCRGLIEASWARASNDDPIPVFRGFMPRPH